MRILAITGLMMSLMVFGLSERGLAADLTVRGNLTSGSCTLDIVGIPGSGGTLTLRSVSPSEFTQGVKTASLHGLQVSVGNCTGVNKGAPFSVTFSGHVLGAHPEVFNDSVSDSIGFMLKENPQGTADYYAGTKASFYDDPGTVMNGKPTYTGSVMPEKDPDNFVLNYFIGTVAPDPDHIDPMGRALIATLTLTFNYK